MMTGDEPTQYPYQDESMITPADDNACILYDETAYIEGMKSIALQSIPR